MKRSWTLALVVALMLTLVVSVPGFAQDATPEAETPAVTCPRFGDADADGICDRAEAGGMGWHHMGRGMGHGMGPAAQGQSFVDEDGDGICDNCGTGEPAQMGRMGHWNTGRWYMGPWSRGHRSGHMGGGSHWSWDR